MVTYIFSILQSLRVTQPNKKPKSPARDNEYPLLNFNGVHTCKLKFIVSRNNKGISS